MSRNPTLIDDEVEQETDEPTEQGGDQSSDKHEGGSGDEQGTKGSGSDADSSEEEEGGNEYDVTDNFIAPEGEEDEGEESESDEEGGRRKKRKKRRREHEDLDEEDYELLDEAGIRRRPKASQRKRIRKREDAAADRPRDVGMRIQEELFGMTEEGIEDLPDDTPAGRRSGRATPEDEEPFSDEDDFIDDDLGGGQAGQRRRHKRFGGGSRLSNKAMQEAFDIFGDADEMVAEYQEMQERNRQRGQAAALEEEDGEDLALEEPDEDDEEAMQAYLKQKEEQEARRQRKVTEKIEPGVMAKHFMRPEDEAIRAQDMPERQQLATIRLQTIPDWRECAEWVYSQLFAEGTDRPRATSDDAVIIEEGMREVQGRGYTGNQLINAQPELDLGKMGLRGILKERTDRRDRRAWHKDEAAQEELKGAIEAVLHELHNEHHEVPFLAQYRKEICGELLCFDHEREAAATTRQSSRSDFPAGTMQAKHRRLRQWQPLYRVQRLAHRWLQLQQRKEQRLKLYQPLTEKLRDTAHETALADLLEMAREAKSPEELGDVDKRLRLLQEAAAAENPLLALKQLGLGKSKGAIHLGYVRALQANLYDLYKEIFLSPNLLAENVENDLKQHIPEDPRDDPETKAAGHLVDALEDAGGGLYVLHKLGLEDAGRVLEALHMLAVAELVAEPSLRRALRTAYREFAVISTVPTTAGASVLNPFHPFGLAKRLRRMPCSLVHEDHFLRIHEAEMAGLVKVTIKDEEASDPDEERPAGDEVPDNLVFNKVVSFYLSGNLRDVSKRYEELRSRALKEALGLLLPELERELRANLLQEARDYLLTRATREAFKLASVAPRVVRDRDEEDVPVRRFCTVVWGPGGRDGMSTTLVMLDAQGGLQDMLFCTHLSGALRRGRDFDASSYQQHIAMDPQKGADLRRVLDFVTQHVPHVILVGAGSMHCQVLLRYMRKLCEHILDNETRTLTRTETGSIEAKFADERVAQLWEKSLAALEEMPDQPTLVRRAVALGRIQLAGQVPVMCSLAANNSREILGLQLADMQQYVPQDELYRAVEQALVTIVSQVGVDINLAAHTPWQAAQVQFVPGMGPRKARELLKRVVQQEHVIARRDMLELFGRNKKVFWNAASSLRISTAGPGMVNEDLDPLDNSRVHPEHYRTLVKRLCHEALQAASSGGRYSAQDDELAVEKVMGKPSLLYSVNMQALADDLAEEGHPSALPALIDIAFELTAPYADLRPRLEDIRTKDELWVLSGETRETLKRGRPVQAQVHGVTKFCVFCTVTDLSDLEAIILKEDISSSEITDPSDRVRRGDTVNARIKQIQEDPDAFADQGPSAYLYLTTSSKELANEARWEEEYCLHETSGYYHVLSEDQRRRQEAAKQRRQNRDNLVQRPIFHPSFRNVSVADAVELLDKDDTQTWLLRPSPRGPGQIVLTMQLFGPAILNVDVMEAVKSGSVQQRLRLSTPLTVTCPGMGTEQYEDIDDLIANFITPYLDHVREITTHRKWDPHDWEGMKEVLKSSSVRPNYRLGVLYDMPGMFYIGKLLRNTPHREAFTVNPNGFWFRREMHSTIEHLLDRFKKNPDAPAQKAADSGRPALAAGSYGSIPGYGAASFSLQGYEQPGLPSQYTYASQYGSTFVPAAGGAGAMQPVPVPGYYGTQPDATGSGGAPYGSYQAPLADQAIPPPPAENGTWALQQFVSYQQEVPPPPPD